jgi:hypothetical protein
MLFSNFLPSPPKSILKSKVVRHCVNTSPKCKFAVIYQVWCALIFIENVHYTWKAAEKGFKMAFLMNKLAMINSCEIILEK